MEESWQIFENQCSYTVTHQTVTWTPYMRAFEPCRCHFLFQDSCLSMAHISACQFECEVSVNSGDFQTHRRYFRRIKCSENLQEMWRNQELTDNFLEDRINVYYCYICKLSSLPYKLQIVVEILMVSREEKYCTVLPWWEITYIPY